MFEKLFKKVIPSLIEEKEINVGKITAEVTFKNKERYEYTFCGEYSHSFKFGNEWVDSITGGDDRDENCMPYSSNHAYQSQLDGTSDIFAIQEVSNGNYEDFGYFSNYNSHPYKSNLIEINGKEVFPLREIPVIQDPLVYNAKFLQTSITSKKPNIQMGAAGGAAAGAAATAYFSSIGPLMMAGPIGWIVAIVIVVFVVVAMIFGKKQKLNEQNFEWIIYKLIPNERYIKSEAEKWKGENDKPKNYKNYSSKYDHRKEPQVIGNSTKVV